MTERTRAHPSYLELDRLALGASDDEALKAHVTGCEACRAHLDAVAPAASVPAWVLRASAARPRRIAPWTSGALGVLALAAALALALLRPPREPDYDTRKGMPSVWVHVQHDDVASPWDGTPLTPGDRIRLEIAPDAYRYVVVFARAADGGAPTLLYRDALAPHRPHVLPKAWRIDDDPRPERLAVVLARYELSAAAALHALRARDPKEIQVLEITLPKRAP